MVVHVKDHNCSYYALLKANGVYLEVEQGVGKGMGVKEMQNANNGGVNKGMVTKTLLVPIT